MKFFGKYFNYLESGLGPKSILLFMALLIISAILLISRREEYAKYVANIAYLFLVIGGVIRLFQLLR